jgi:hypothetical protein
MIAKAGLSMAAAIKAAEAQLAYWQQECEAARRANDLNRIARCEKYIAQCELVVSGLHEADPAHNHKGEQLTHSSSS